jgi:hypothetical protein
MRTEGDGEGARAVSVSSAGLLLHRALEAHGIVRDGLTAIRNLENLLRSPRVGSRPLLSVIPDLRELCEPVKTAVGSLLARLPDGSAGEGAGGALFAFVVQSLDELARALDRGALAPLDAKARLSLEARVHTAGVELDAVRILIDMMTAAAEGGGTELDLAEVVHQAFASSTRVGAAPAGRITVAAAIPDEPSLCSANPRVFMPLLSLAIGLVHRESGVAPSVDATGRDGESVVIRIATAPLEGDLFAFYLPTLIPPTKACAVAAAESAGAGFHLAEDGREIVMLWPAG